MGFFDVIMGTIIALLAMGLYWYTSTVTCPLYGRAFTKIGSSCMFFFCVMITGLLLVATYFFFRFASANKQHKHSYHYLR